MMRPTANTLSYLSLFTSFGTLVCCALPSLLVLVGLGATVASVLSAAPWLVALSRHKEIVFAFSGALIATNFVYVYNVVPKLRVRSAACAGGRNGACEDVSAFGRTVLWISAALYLVGFFTAFLLAPLLARLSA
jgi:hypothetical protein